MIRLHLVLFNVLRFISFMPEGLRYTVSLHSVGDCSHSLLVLMLSGQTVYRCQHHSEKLRFPVFLSFILLSYSAYFADMLLFFAPMTYVFFRFQSAGSSSSLRMPKKLVSCCFTSQSKRCFIFLPIDSEN
jgi:hypothetical protein